MCAIKRIRSHCSLPSIRSQVGSPAPGDDAVFASPAWRSPFTGALHGRLCVAVPEESGFPLPSNFHGPVTWKLGSLTS